MTVAQAQTQRVVVVHARDGVKDSVESIVVALILAFVFRAFIVEAFVIPTGSMAATLYGAHGTLVCEDCGWEYAYGLLDQPETQRRERPSVGEKATTKCPNCNHANGNLPYSDAKANAESGDRILVLKWPYDLGGPFGPRRWDVTVFKNPADGEQNYIKRLAGLPGEVLMIVDGDVYTVPVGELSAASQDELQKHLHDKHAFRTGEKRGRLGRVSEAVLQELDTKLKIARKSELAQSVLWTVVYDHDHKPKTPTGGKPRWQPSVISAWDVRERNIAFLGGDKPGGEGSFIELVGKQLVATHAYNIIEAARAAPPVSDMRVRFVFSPSTSDSVVWVCLTKVDRSFMGMVSADGRVAIYEADGIPRGGAKPFMEGRISVMPPGSHTQVEFSNVDYRLQLLVAGQRVLQTADAPTDAAYYGPDLRAIRGRKPDAAVPPRLYAGGGPFSLAHLAVERDIYYHKLQSSEVANEWLVGSVDWGGDSNPILLRDWEYFMLGDNSPASQDSRLWGSITQNKYLQERGEQYQLGTVPRDQLIGRAFFVYFPSGHRIHWLPILDAVGIIPDVGRMRWIR